MDPRNDPFQSKGIDAHIEWLAQHTPDAAQDRDLSAQLVQRLQRHYVAEQRQDTLKRAWERLTQRYEVSALASSEEVQAHHKQRKLERSGQYSMQQKTMEVLPVRRPLSYWGAMVAFIVVALMIGGTAIIIGQAAHLKGNTRTGGRPAVICPTPTPEQTKTPQPTIPPTPQPTILPTPQPTILPTPSRQSEASAGCATPGPSASVPTPAPTLPVSGTPYPTPTPISLHPTPTPSSTISPATATANK